MQTILSFLLLAAPPQQRVRIELEHPVNRSSVIEKTQVEKSHLTERRDAGPVQRHESSARSSHRYEERVLTVSQGKPKKIRRTYTKATESFEDHDTKKKSSRNTGFHGKTVTLTRDGAHTIVETEDETRISKEDKVQLRLRDDPILESIPRTEIGPGTRWAINAKALSSHVSAQLGGFSVLRANGTTEFVKWEQNAGVRCAVLEASTRVRAVNAGGTLTLNLTNRIRYWYDPIRKAMIKIEGNGRQELSGTVKASTGTFTYGGYSTTNYREERTFP